MTSIVQIILRGNDTMEKIVEALQSQSNKDLFFSKKGCDLINHIQEMIARERIVIKNEKEILIPGCQVQLVNDGCLNAFVKKYDGEYYIFVNKGFVEEQREYLESLSWDFISCEKKKKDYINGMIEYGFYFTAFHEYAHIYCGHVDANLENTSDILAQECEADMVSMDYLLKYILSVTPIDNYMVELEKLFLSIYFIFERMQKQNGEEWYNNRLIQNYYDEYRIQKRNHPLDAQRILYLYEMLNIVILADKKYLLPVKNSILDKLVVLKGFKDKEIPNRDLYYHIVENSVKELKKSIENIRIKIPRLKENI